MGELRRELILGAALVAVALLGLGLDAVGPRRTRPDESRRTGSIVERANFCPPLYGEGEQRVSVASTTEREASVLIEPDKSEPSELGSGELMVRRVQGAGGHAVTGFGERLVVGSSTSLTEPAMGSAAAGCTESASTRWFFPEGSTVLGADERLLIYNPFPDEAVVEVTLFSPAGDQTKAGLSDVAVPAGEAVEVALNDYVRIQNLVSAGIEAERGRVVAWRYSALGGEGLPGGVQATLGAPDAATTWYFPEGGTGDAFDERIALLNPSEKEAAVNIIVSTSERVTSPDELVQIPLPPLSAKAVSLPDDDGASRSVSVRVLSSNDVGIVAERSVAYEGSIGGASSEIGSPVTATRWLAPPPLVGASSDDLSILNPGARTARVDVTFVSADGAISPKDLQGLEILPGLRRGVSLEDRTNGSVVAVVTGDRDVVVERVSYSSESDDAAALMGTPVTPGGAPVTRSGPLGGGYPRRSPGRRR